MRQAESLIEDEAFRQRIIANAKEYVESNCNENVEFEAYSKIAKDMCRSVMAKNEDTKNADEPSDTAADRKVRFNVDKKKGRISFGTEDSEKQPALKSASTETPDATAEEAHSSEKQSEEQNQVVENETLHQEPEDNANASQSTSDSKNPVGYIPCNVTPPDGEERNPETSQSPSRPSFRPEENKNATEEDVVVKLSDKPRVNPLVDISSSANPTSSPRGPKAVTTKTDIRKRNTDSPLPRSNPEKNSSPAAARKGGGTAGKNGQKQQTVVTPVSDGSRKTMTSTLKKTPLASTSSVDKTMLKPPSAHRSATRTVSDTAVFRTPASRSMKTKK